MKLTAEQNEMILSNMGLVHKTAKDLKWSIRSSWFHYSDLISVGTIGLINAVENYENNKGITFAAYAVPVIRRSMLKALNKQMAGLSVPDYIIELVPRLKSLENWGNLSVEEVASILGIPTKKARNLLIAVNRPDLISMDSEVREDRDYNEVFGARTDYGMIYVNDFLNTLKERDKEILEAKLAGYSQQEIASMYGTSPQAISQRFKLNIRPKCKEYYAEV
ncbi:hypothetical protein CHH59_12590 [Shouchella clausii]|uniref:sigma-70 family RNA polymerase sigma factor n=1 Tax=Shouchella clausii TaxID=79880 RepID=UPI000BA60767|nr:sigma-70 family RNA polymerase sigma factor [Shouchella clausii]PAF13680.1 hypothetical protein CHH59_12590 [Shouchella clausii]